ncbi:MAG TPA: exopolysaccharide biosynthesis protein [Lysobacter sp.]|jgi:hypothetical protein
MTQRARPERPHEAGTRALLDGFAEGDPNEQLRMSDVLHGLGDRSFGMLLFVSTIPAFIPIPGLGGAISGPLVILIGLQQLFGMREPWLPAFLAKRGPHRSAMARFRDLLAPWLTRLEKLVRPRATVMLDHRLADFFTGLQLVLLGLLLSLPIPFTNFLFGGLLVVFALALLERDGYLMGIAWVAGVISIAVFGVLSGSLAAAAARWIDMVM